MHRSVKQDDAAHKPQWPKRSKKHTLKQPMKQPMEQAIKQSARELARWCRNTESQYSTGSTLESKWLMLRVRNSIFRWYSTYCISVLTTNMHREWCSVRIAEDKQFASEKLA